MVACIGRTWRLVAGNDKQVGWLLVKTLDLPGLDYIAEVALLNLKKISQIWG